MPVRSLTGIVLIALCNKNPLNYFTTHFLHKNLYNEHLKKYFILGLPYLRRLSPRVLLPAAGEGLPQGQGGPLSQGVLLLARLCHRLGHEDAGRAQELPRQHRGGAQAWDDGEAGGRAPIWHILEAN